MYLPTDGEVDLLKAVPVLVDRGWDLHLPVIGDDRSMTFRRWRPDDALVANRFGIGEPASGAAQRSAGDLDVVVVPCVAVDRRGARWGFGAGYYDRALAAPAHPTTVAVAFAVQVVDALAQQEWDVAMDVVVTDEGIIRPGG
jgi:5-formyltetrahydrofolate cyclo-ligase